MYFSKMLIQLPNQKHSPYVQGIKTNRTWIACQHQEGLCSYFFILLPCVEYLAEEAMSLTSVLFGIILIYYSL